MRPFFDSELIMALIGFIPIILILFGMLRLRIPSHIAGPAALLTGIVLAIVCWGMPVGLIPGAVLEGVLLGLFPIIWVVFAALFTYNLSIASGAIDKIKKMLVSVSSDIRIQGIILAFCFGGFLEAVAGFGTAVAIPAGLMTAMGFNPMLAVIVCLVANTVPVAFGVAGIPVITLSMVTGLPLGDLSAYAALQMLPFIILLPLLIVMIISRSIKGEKATVKVERGKTGLKGVLGVSLISGICFGIGQTLAACFIGPEPAAFAGSLLSLASVVVWCRIRPVKNARRTADHPSSGRVGMVDALRSWSPYILILAIVLATRLLPGLKSLGAFLTNPGTIIFVAAITGGLLQRLNLKAIAAIAVRTLKQMTKTIITILSIVSLAKVMSHGGMIASISEGISSLAGKLFPFVAPFFGALGTLITGSDTSSNVLFGELQKQTAMAIDADPSWLAAANASGAAAGKLVSPQSISIAVSATGLTGSESKILSVTLKYALVFTGCIGLIILIFSR